MLTCIVAGVAAADAPAPNAATISEGIAQYRRVLEVETGANARHDAYASLGHIHAEAGRLFDAADAFNAALRIAPDDAFTRYSLGRVYLELKEERAALRQYEELARLESEYAEDLHIAIYQQAVRDRPQDSDAHFNLGNAYYKRAERYEEAIEPYQQAIRLNPDLELAYSRLGYCYIELGRYDDAIAAFSGAIRINPHDVPDRVNLGLAYSHTGVHAQAIEQLEEAVRLQPDSAIAHMNLGYVLRSSGQSSKAIEPLGRAIRLGPDEALAHYNLARAYFDLSRYREAVEEFQRAIRLNASEAELAKFHFHLGETYSRLKRYRLATESFAAAVDLKPNYVEARFRLGVAYLRLGDRESALGECRDLKAAWDERLGAELESLIGISCSR